MNDHVYVARRLMSAYGAEIKRLRDVRDMSTRQVAELIGVRHDIINRVESGKWIPTPDEEAKLSHWIRNGGLW